jgi:hypothetical protein
MSQANEVFTGPRQPGPFRGIKREFYHCRRDATRRPYIDESTSVVVVELPGNATAAGAADYWHPRKLRFADDHAARLLERWVDEDVSRSERFEYLLVRKGTDEGDSLGDVTFGCPAFCRTARSKPMPNHG